MASEVNGRTLDGGRRFSFRGVFSGVLPPPGPVLNPCPTVDESFAQLHAAGWSVGDVRLLAPSGPRWLVTGTNGENALRAEGDSQAEAWAQAVEQARAVGMLGRSARKEQRR